MEKRKYWFIRLLNNYEEIIKNWDKKEIIKDEDIKRISKNINAYLDHTKDSVNKQSFIDALSWIDQARNNLLKLQDI